jgi:hypothetical protein
MSWLGRPGLHFLVLGGMLFAAERAFHQPPAPAAARPPIVVDAARLREEFAERSGLVPTAADESALVERAIEEELLYHEALARGLDRHDRSIRHRLAEKMRFLSPDAERTAEEYYRDALALGLERDDVIVRRMLVEKMRLLIAAASATDEPGDAALVAHVAAHPERYGQPARVRLWQAFAGSSAAAAERLLATLRAAHASPEDGVGQGLPFPLGGGIGPSSEAQLARLFGAEFARAVFALPTGTWAGPVASAYGFHLVWVDRREDATLPALAEVRSRAREALRAEERPERLRQALAALRGHYDIRVLGSAS